MNCGNELSCKEFSLTSCSGSIILDESKGVYKKCQVGVDYACSIVENLNLQRRQAEALEKMAEDQA